MPLNDARIRALKSGDRPTKHGDGGGLLLIVNPNGSKLWRMVYRYGGKQKQLSFGAWPDVSLAQARAQRDEARKLLADHIDPSQKKKQDKIAKAAAASNTFAALADEFLDKVRREGRAETTLAKKRWLIGLAEADLGDRPISEITAAEILVPLRRVEAEGNYETARRLRATISQVFRFAIATARAPNDPTGGLKGALIAPKPTHRAAITDWEGFGGLVRAVWSYGGAVETCAALKLMVLLYPRPGELRQAEWVEFDLDRAVWTIPAKRTKMRREHRKPLSSLALEILLELRDITGNRQLVFPSYQNPERPLSENTMNAALRRLGFGKEEMTSHGFRASASTFLNESGLWSPDAIEAELAHVGADEVRRAYHRGLHWEERVRMAAWWAKEISSCLGSRLDT